MKRKGSAMGSSKYELNPDDFEKDMQDKREVANKFRQDLNYVINEEYRYRDNVPMSQKAKLEILLDEHRNFYEKVNGPTEFKEE